METADAEAPEPLTLAELEAKCCHRLGVGGVLWKREIEEELARLKGSLRLQRTPHVMSFGTRHAW